MAELLMEAAELAVTVATESVEPTLVARVVDVGCDAAVRSGVTKGRRWRRRPA